MPKAHSASKLWSLSKMSIKLHKQKYDSVCNSNLMLCLGDQNYGLEFNYLSGKYQENQA